MSGGFGPIRQNGYVVRDPHQAARDMRTLLGATDTPLVAVAQPPAVREAVLAAIPVGRNARADEIASVITFLAGPESTFVTGQTWCVDGGQSAGPGCRMRDQP